MPAEAWFPIGEVFAIARNKAQVIHGPVKLHTVNGSISAADLSADAQLESVNGSLRAQFDSIERVHDIHLESVNGRAEVTLPKGPLRR